VRSGDPVGKSRARPGSPIDPNTGKDMESLCSVS
jgi:hypothetical protein